MCLPIFPMMDADPLGAAEDGPTAPAPARLVRIRKSATAVILDVDGAVEPVLGWSRDDIVGKTSLDFMHPDDQALAVENWMQMLASSGPGRPVRLRHLHKDGSWVWFELTNHNHLDDADIGAVVAEMLEISEPDVAPEPAVAESRPMKVHEALRDREHVLHRLAEAIPLGVMHLDAHGRVLYTNQQLHVILGQDRAPTYAEQLAMVVPDDARRVAEAFDAALHSGLDTDVELRVALADDGHDKHVKQCTLNVRALVADNGEVTGAVACLTDVTDSVRMRDELRLRATFDPLTKCFNRASTVEALEQMLLGGPGGSTPAVIFVDLDDLKGVNDDLGHAAGDSLLEVVASRLQHSVRAQDVVGRIGGDEFLVLCPGIGTAAQAMRAATRIARGLEHAVRLKSVQVSCRASIGVAWAPGSRLDADTLISRADTAMYEAKRTGSRRPVMYVAPRPA